MLGEGGDAHLATVRALVAGGVDVNLADGDGVRPLAHAEDRGYAAIARVLTGGRRALLEGRPRRQPPSARSSAAAAASATSSRHGRATSCTPIGSPSGELPQRTTAAGQPVRLYGVV